jgi:catechol 2,3-dioxygenase-like lactoylglutathione lyase family enzyme
MLLFSHAVDLLAKKLSVGAMSESIRQFHTSNGDLEMNWTLEVVVVPVSDIDTAKTFYGEMLGFNVDHDTRINDDFRIIQLTPTGSGCSIVISKGMTDMQPGTIKGLQLVVNDVRAAHAYLEKQGVKTSPVQVYGNDGKLRLADETDDLNNRGFVFFNDPDGNSWAVQQITARP